MQEVNGFAALLSTSLSLENVVQIMNYRSWLGSSVQRRGNVSLGLCLMNEDTQEFSAIHGEFYGAPLHRISEVSYLPKLLATSDGSYSFVLPIADTLIFARDQLGTKPLFYARGAESFGISSDARILQKLSFNEVNLAEPGVLYKATPNSLTQISFNTLNHDVQSVQHDEALQTVSRLLDESVRKMVAGKRKIVLGFSGGIDSAILSILAAKYTKIKPATVCVKDSIDYKLSQSIADKFGMPLEMIVVDEKLIRNVIKELRNITQFGNAMHTSIACIVYLLANFAKENGADALMLGQLADELFGGYARYLKYLRSSTEKVSNAMFSDVKNAHKDNFCRDEMASSPFTRLLLPYASLDLVKYAVNLPVDLKINSKTGVRKIILRELAKNIGIDDELASREKKAMQFSSGIFKIVSKL